ncbi:putative entry exclusion protein TrbK-alt [Mesorhizobium sp. 43Arga]
MNLKIAARMMVVLCLCAAMAATFMALRGNGSLDVSSPRSAHPGGEPATVELARCRAMGVAAAADPACRRAWSENRRRFFGTDMPPMPMPERFSPMTNRPVSP